MHLLFTCPYILESVTGVEVDSTSKRSIRGHPKDTTNSQQSYMRYAFMRHNRMK